MGRKVRSQVRVAAAPPLLCFADVFTLLLKPLPPHVHFISKTSSARSFLFSLLRNCLQFLLLRALLFSAVGGSSWSQKRSFDESLRTSIATGQKVSAMAIDKVQKLIQENPVIVFSKSYCPYCTRVKQLLSSLGANAKIVELDQQSDGSEIQAALGKISGLRTVPNVFIGGQHIGGCDDTTSFHKKNKLVPMLKDVGAIKMITT